VEIIDYLRVLRMRLAVLIGLPLLSVAGVAVGVFVVEPHHYTVTATVAAPALVGGATYHQYAGANADKAFVYNFISSATSDVVLQQVADQVHLSKKEIRSGLTASESGQQSSLIQLTYTTSDRKMAAPVITAVASDTLRYLFSSQLQLAQAPVTQAQAALTSNQLALAAIRKQAGVAEPDQTLNVLQGELASEQETQAVQRADGNATTAANLAPSVAALQNSISVLTPEAAAYTKLLNQQTVDEATLRQDQGTLQQAQSQYGAANPADGVVVVGNTGNSKILTIFGKDIVLAFGGALTLALVLIAILEIFTRGNKAQAGAPDEPTPDGGHRDMESAPMIGAAPKIDVDA
jgi:capsular polysaccharide biosynthesis protein